MKTVRIGVIGAGRIGKIHATNLAQRVPGATLAAISDPVPGAAKAAAEGLNIKLVTTDEREILESKEIDAVAICSPTDTHARLIEAAAARGKHVFCEKPIDLDLTVIRRALAAVKDAGIKLQVGFNRRFDPNFARAAALVREGKVGTPHLVRITSRDPGPPPLEYVKVSGGLFLDMTIHDFDMARFLVADEVVEVSAAAACLVDPKIGQAGDVDTAVVTLRYKNGAIGAIDNSRRAAYGYDQRVEVLGTGGCVAVGNDTPTRTSVWDGGGQHADPPLHFFLERYQEAYMREMRAFVSAVLEGKPVPVSGDDGLQAARIAVAAKRSAELGRPVKLSEVETHGDGDKGAKVGTRRVPASRGA